MLSERERSEFVERGLLRLPGAADPDGVAALRASVLEHVAGRRLVPDPAPPGFVVKATDTAAAARRHRFEEIWGKRVIDVVDALLDGAWRRPETPGQVLPMHYPISGASWALPHKVWHLDFRAPGAQRGLPGVQLFVCLDRVEPRAGATLVACGTHRLTEALQRRMAPSWEGRSADVRRRLAAGVPWLRELWSLREGEDRIARFMSSATRFEQVSLQVAELYGEPGDVYVMHPWMLHAPAPNCGTRPRLVLTERIHAPAV